MTELSEGKCRFAVCCFPLSRFGNAFHTELDVAGWGTALFADQVSSDQAHSLLVPTPG